MRQAIIEYKGYKGMRAIAEMAGIPEGTLRHRIVVQGYSVEEAVALKKDQRKQFEYKGYVGLKDIAEAFGVNYNTLRRRLSVMGLSIEEAVNMKTNYPTERKAPKKRKEVVATKSPVELSQSWRMALGMGGAA